MSEPTCPLIIEKHLADIGWARESIDLVLAHAHEPRMQRAFRRITGDSLPPRNRTKKACIPRHLRRSVFERDAYRCQVCSGWADLTVDHIHPESLGGALEPENLQTLCRSCNSRKGVKQ